MIHAKLQTHKNLSRKGVIGSSICYMCMKNRENTFHLFNACLVARAVWMLFEQEFRPWRLRLTYSIMELWDTNRKVIQGDKRKYRDQIWLAASWEIWLERNKRIFRRQALLTNMIAKRARMLANSWRDTG
ncbi:hypothetical protein LUZ60_014313 [Juncus effusus]|nr:hypothetical protein LUZ60_014313 [Juncus effusus]